MSYEMGVIHGRFQVLHNDHMRYLLSGKEHCRHLVVGITNPDPTLTGHEQADPGRSASDANPLTYFERYCLVRAALEGAGINLSELSIVPLPINFPHLYRYYVPMDAAFFLSIYDDWGREKLRKFQDLGLRTHVLREVSPEQKGISGSDVRRAMREGRGWEHLVPPAVAHLLRMWDVPGRLMTE